jgi:DNA-binding NtrC family response regulator
VTRLAAPPGCARGAVAHARRVIAAKRPVVEEVAAGRLRADLARRLERVELALPALRDRREDILPLVACFARRFASEEGLRAPALDEGALALLWRQDWRGDVRELENFVYKLVLATRSSELFGVGSLGVESVLKVARANDARLLRKIPSRHPRRSDLIAALRVSRTLGGRFNKTRAAMFLGWDPGLVARRSGLGDGPGWPLARLGASGRTPHEKRPQGPFRVARCASGEAELSGVRLPWKSKPHPHPYVARD